MDLLSCFRGKCPFVIVLLTCLVVVGLSGRSSAETFCVGTWSELQSALSAAAGNGQDDIIQIVQGTYEGNFIYISSQGNGITIQGGFFAGCTSRALDPANTVLDGANKETVLVLSDPLGELLIEGVTLTNGNAGDNAGEDPGGGLFAKGYSIDIRNNRITGNKPCGAYTSAGFGTVSLSYNTIMYNEGDGGLYDNASSHVSVVGNMILANNSGWGGGICLFGISSTSAVIVNNLIAKNKAAWGGGLYAPTKSLILVNNTIADNSATFEGGGISVEMFNKSDTAIIYNNIIVNNRSRTGSDVYIENDGDNDYSASFLSVMNNDFDQSGAGTYLDLPFTFDPSNLNNVDPLFVNSEANDYHLQAGSQCIDAGTNSAPNLPETDLEGSPRIENGAVNMGAYEANLSTGPGAAKSEVVAMDMGGVGSGALAVLGAAGDIYYATEVWSIWFELPGKLNQIAAGDVDGDGRDDILGTTSSGQIFYNTDLYTWNCIPGALSQVTAGDLNGDGKDDVIGVTSGGAIFYTLDLATWQVVPGVLKSIVAGDLNGDGKADLAGLTAAGQIYFTLDLQNWQYLPGTLGQLGAGDMNGDGKAELVGLSESGQIFYTTDLAAWQWLPGTLTQVTAGKVDGVCGVLGMGSDGVIYFTSDLHSWRAIPGPDAF